MIYLLIGFELSFILGQIHKTFYMQDFSMRQWDHNGSIKFYETIY